jgi:molybdenum cofactor synthesis domain-containing protein
MASVKAAVLTVSDRVSRGEAEDRSGPAAAEILQGIGFEVVEVRVVHDGVESVSAALEAMIPTAGLIVTSGGTGFTQRDLTPEGTLRVIERQAPGIAEAIRAASYAVNPHGMLSRGVAGICGSTLIVNLPGSERAVRESLATISPALRHAVELLVTPGSDHNTG